MTSVTGTEEEAIAEDVGRGDISPWWRKLRETGNVRRVTKNRLEAFSDGVLAVVITIMVLEIKVPHGGELHDLEPLLPLLCSYVLSFVYVGIYWNNHHHLIHVTKKISGGVMWANLHLLFWISLVPVTTGWVGEHGGAPWPVVFYGLVLMMASVAWAILARTIVARNGPNSIPAQAMGNALKERVSTALYAAAVGLAFVRAWISLVLYAAVALMWVIPDKRIEKHVAAGEAAETDDE